jgi:hypothetical protein
VLVVFLPLAFSLTPALSFISFRSSASLQLRVQCDPEDVVPRNRNLDSRLRLASTELIEAKIYYGVSTPLMLDVRELSFLSLT